MLGANKIEKYKKLVSVLLLTFCAVFAFILILGIISNCCISNVAYIRANGATVKFELTDEVTLQDTTIEKLTPKLKLTGSTDQGKFNGLVRVTSANIMFNYTLNNQDFYLLAMGKEIKTISQDTYRATAGYTYIYNKTQLESFRDDVNISRDKGIVDPYKGCTVKLCADIYLNTGDWRNWTSSWIPIGYPSNKDKVSYFSGTFDGQGHTIYNLYIKMTDGKQFLYNAVKTAGAGFFGAVRGATIKNLKLDMVKFKLYDSSNKYGSGWEVNYAVGCLVGGVLTGSQTTISNCWVRNGDLDVVSDRRKCSASAGGLVGSVENLHNSLEASASISISDCDVECDIRTCGENGSDFTNAGGIIGYVSYCGNVTVKNCSYRGNIYLDEDGSDKYAPADRILCGGIVGYTTLAPGQSYLKITGCLSWIKSGSTFCKTDGGTGPNDKKIAPFVCADNEGRYSSEAGRYFADYSNNRYVTGSGCLDWDNTSGVTKFGGNPIDVSKIR